MTVTVYITNTLNVHCQRFEILNMVPAREHGDEGDGGLAWRCAYHVEHSPTCSPTVSSPMLNTLLPALPQ